MISLSFHIPQEKQLHNLEQPGLPSKNQIINMRQEHNVRQAPELDTLFQSLIHH